jgi:hypothetical protein
MQTRTQCVARGVLAAATAPLLTLIVTLLVPHVSAQADAQVAGHGASVPRGPLTPLHGGQLAELSLSEGRWVETPLPARLTGEIELPLELEGVSHTLVLRPSSLRSADFVLRVQGADLQGAAGQGADMQSADAGQGAGVLSDAGQGAVVQNAAELGAAGLLAPVSPAPPSTVRGELLGRPGSAAAGALVDGTLQLLISPGEGAALWGLDALPSGGHALFPMSAVVDQGGVCGSLTPQAITPPTQAMVAAASAPMVAELAVDADYEYYLAHGSSVADVLADIEGVVAASELIYSADAAISFQLTSVTVRTDPDDPYETTDPGALLSAFRAHWNAEHTGVARDLAHLFTGSNLDGSVIGIAYVGVVCSSSSGYGLSQSLFTNNFSRRVALTAHELGHNWSANHCNGDPDCAIMCSGLGGCSGELEQFGAAAIASIEAEKGGSWCLSPGVSVDGPVLESVFPAFGPVSGGTELELHGSALPTGPGAVVTLAGLPAEVLSAGESLVRVSTPAALSAGGVDVQLSGPTGVALLEGAFAYDVVIPSSGAGATKSAVEPDEIARFHLGAPAGARLSASLRRLHKAEGMLPGLRVIGPGEQLLVELQADPDKPGKPLKLKQLELPTSGDHRVEVFGLDGSAGAFKLVSKLRPMKLLKQTHGISPATPTVAVPFAAAAGSVLKLARFRALPSQGGFEEIEGQPAALVPTLVSLTGPDGPIPIDGELQFSPNGKTVRLAGVPLPTFGDYVLELGGLDGSVGHGKLLVRVKPGS